jgi:hypothetical protein
MPLMAWWNTGDEEHADERLRQAGLAAFGLYVAAGSWCLGEIRSRSGLPQEWLIPDWFVTSWGPEGRRAAKKLVEVGLWKRVQGGYLYAWIRATNTPDAVAKRRKWWRENKAGEAGDPQ